MMRIWFVIALFCAALARVGAADAVDTNSWKGRVLVVEQPAATVAFDPQPAPIRDMVRAGVTAYTGATNEVAAWRTLVSTNDTVGIKVYSAPGASGSRKAVAEGIVQGLLAAGLPAKKIIIWDRRLSDLRQAGFFDLAERYNVRVAGAVEAGFDDKKFYETALLGKLVYGDHEFGRVGDDIGRRSYVSTLVTSNMTKIINLVPLLNHNLAGVVGTMHSLAMGSVDNILRFESDPDRLGTAVPEIYALEPIGDRVVLSIVDALIAQYQGEERTLYHYSVTLNELWFSKDPVALDLLSVHELARQRKKADAPPLRLTMDIFANAALLDLGYDDPLKFHIERLVRK